MIEQHDYPVSVLWTGGKRGLASSRDDLPRLEVATPPEFGGERAIWSPEHLLVGAVASCYMTTFLAIAERSHIDVHALEVDVEGRLERGEDRLYRFTAFTVRPRIEVPSGADLDKVERVARKAEAVCLVTRSLDASVTLEPRIFVAVVEPTLS